MKTHTMKGCELLTDLDSLRDQEYFEYAYRICRYHHERWDGNGYPDGLKGDSIPICAQVVAIADCYDALTTDRVYKKAIAPQPGLQYDSEWRMREIFSAASGMLQKCEG